MSGIGSPILAPVEGTFVQILAGQTPDSLALVIGPAGGTFGLRSPGFFDAGPLISFSLTPNSNAWFQIRAWRNDQSWEQAVRNKDAFVGASVVFQNPTGIEEAFHTDVAYFRNAPSFTVSPVPEVSTAILIGVGLAISFLYRKVVPWSSKDDVLSGG